MTVYYVDGVGGSDANDGLSVGTAWQTIQKAFDEFGVTLATHDEVRIMATADYDLAGTELTSTGNWLGVMTGANASGDVDGIRAKITTSVAQPSLFNINSQLTNYSFLDFDGNSLATHGLLAEIASVRNYWHYCLFHNAVFTGSQQSYAGGQCRHRFFRCKFYDNGDNGAHARGAYIIECEAYNNGGAGFFAPQTDGVISGCRVYGNAIGVEGLNEGASWLLGNTIDGNGIGIDPAYNSGGFGAANQITNNTTHSIRNVGTQNYYYHFLDNIYGNGGRSTLGNEISLLETAIDPDYVDTAINDFDYTSAAAADPLAPWTMYVGAGNYLVASGGGGATFSGFRGV